MELEKELEEQGYLRERQAEMITELRELMGKDVDLVKKERSAKELGLEGIDPHSLIITVPEGACVVGSSWRIRR